MSLYLFAALFMCWGSGAITVAAVAMHAQREDARFAGSLAVMCLAVAACFLLLNTR